MIEAVPWPLRFQVGARTLGTIRRRLVRVALTLDAALAGDRLALPPLPAAADGYLVTSLPEVRLADLARGGDRLFVRQRYLRHFVDLAAGEAAWWRGLSAKARSTLGRKERRLSMRPGFAIQRFGRPDEIAAFLPRAQAVSRLTYQERLLGEGLPDTSLFERTTLALAAAGAARGWLLRVEGRDIAYLFGAADGATLRYDHVGHDPAWSEHSPGSVLMLAALRDLFAEACFARFDFTPGEGQHKRQLATGGVACCDVLVMRATLPNRLTLAALAGFDRAAAMAKRLTAEGMLAGLARRVRR